MTACQPRRDCGVRSHAVSRRSASSSCISLRFSAPSRMITWQVVQAQLPPQACSSGTWRFLATSRNDSGLPWCEYGSLPCSNSTTVGSPSMMKVTLGIYDARLKPSCDVLQRVDVLAGQRRLDRAVHHHLGEVPGRVVQRVRPLLDRLAVLRVEHHPQPGHHRLDLLPLAGGELFLLD